jgi:hypothetical protein
MFCSDPVVNYLKELGYNTILIPRATLKPLQLFTKKGDRLRLLGDLTTVLVPRGNVAPPTTKEDAPAGNISGRRTEENSRNLMLSVLGGIIGAMGGNSLGLELKYNDAQTISFQFSEVVEDLVEILTLDMYLGDTDISPYSVFVRELFEADNVFVTTSVLKSRKLSVDAKRQNGAGLELEVPVINEVVGGSVNVTGSTDVTSLVTYEGATPLAFAFQAMGLCYKDGKYRRMKSTDDDLVIAAVQPRGVDEDAELLTTRTGFVRLAGM